MKRRWQLARWAQSVVNQAVSRGVLQPVRELSCVDCGKPATAYDHRDYRRPLEVEPVCNGCNRHRPGALPIKTPEEQEHALRHGGRQDSAYIIIRCTPEELVAWKALAKEKGFRGLSPYVRHLLHAKIDRDARKAQRAA